jgi:hypothetical protein
MTHVTTPSTRHTVAARADCLRYLVQHHSTVAARPLLLCEGLPVSETKPWGQTVASCVIPTKEQSRRYLSACDATTRSLVRSG